jgi:CubicO group peptidase (beta-lactamase class C family)
MHSMPRRRLCFAFAALCLLWTGPLPAVDFAPLEARVEQELRDHQIPGCAIAIVLGEEIIFTKGFGVANVETGEPVKADMLFRIGSTTKMFTAAAVVLLAEEGRLRLEAPIGQYVSGLHPRLARVTAHQLLTHTSGLSDLNAINGPHDETALAERVRALGPADFFDEPDRIYSYSNPGYWAAGLVAEVVSGKPYADWLHERLFAPLGMTRTTFRPLLAVTWPFALGHGPEGRAPAQVIRPLSDNAAVWPAGQLFTSAPEFARFCIAFMNGGKLDGQPVLSPFVIEQLSTPHVPVPNDDRHYGYGLSVRDERGNRWLSHSGSRSGYGSIVRMCPANKFAIIILCNKTGANLAPVTDLAAELVLGLPPAPAPARPRPEFNAEEMQRLAGAYRNAAAGLRLMMREGQLVDGRGAPVQKRGENHYVIPAFRGAPPVEFSAVPGENGRIEYLVRRGRALKRLP